jgi:hypothetical protein
MQSRRRVGGTGAVPSAVGHRTLHRAITGGPFPRDQHGRRLPAELLSDMRFSRFRVSLLWLSLQAVSHVPGRLHLRVRVDSGVSRTIAREFLPPTRFARQHEPSSGLNLSGHQAANGRKVMSTLDNLRKAAKRWLKALRANDADARARFGRAHPTAPADPGLREPPRVYRRAVSVS